MQLAQQFVIDELVKRDVRRILADGVAPIRAHIAAGLAAEPALEDLGIELVAVRVAAVAPTAELEKALQQPTREAIQQDADKATFQRRALAVEKERAIAENELQNRIELARREEDLVAQEGANARKRATEQVAAAMVEAQGADERDALAAARKATTIDEVQGAQLRIDEQRARIDAETGRRRPARARAARARRPARPDRAPDDHARHAHPGPGAAERAMTLAPRCVLVERQTEFRDLLARHGTREQARFFLAQRGLALADVEERHLHHEEVRARVLGAIPPDWRSTTVQRADLDRFLFAADDIVVVLGQDGLVANVAKYLDGQPVIGLNPEPERFPGVLVNQAPEAIGDLCADLVAGRAGFELRTMVRASLDDGQALLALNEIFVGHRSHQSARYRLGVGERAEHQSSSGLIAATRDGRDRLGDEHQPPARAAARAAGADRAAARVVRARGVGEPDDGRDADGRAARAPARRSRSPPSSPATAWSSATASSPTGSSSTGASA